MLLIDSSLRLQLIAAVLPGLFLAAYIYRLDSVEREPLGLLVKLFILGALSIIPAAIVEGKALDLLYDLCPETTYLSLAVETFVCVACVEEGGKYFMLRKATWRNPEFNFRFDAIVYAACVGLGFAVFENIQYVLSYGLGVALVRAITAIPAHTIFAVIMGHYYGQAKLQHDCGNEAASRQMLKLAYVMPVLFHGFYDFAASVDSEVFTLIFWGFLLALKIYTYLRLRKDARTDTPA